MLFQKTLQYQAITNVHGYTFGVSVNRHGEQYLQDVLAALNRLSCSEAKNAHDAFMAKGMNNDPHAKSDMAWRAIQNITQPFCVGGAACIVNALHAGQVSVGWLRSDFDFEVIAVFLQPLDGAMSIPDFDAMVWNFIDQAAHKNDSNFLFGLRRQDMPELLELDDATINIIA